MASDTKSDSQSDSLSCCIPLPLSEEILKDIVPCAKDYALLNGAGMRYRERYNAEILEIAPFFLFPSSFPKRDFDYITKLQPSINLLTHRIAHDYDFLHSCLKNTIDVDSFTAHLWNIYETVRKEGITQEVSLGLLRSDVMMTNCEPGCCSKCEEPPFVMEYQVEINTIASGFGHLGPVSARIHSWQTTKSIHNATTSMKTLNAANKDISSYQRIVGLACFVNVLSGRCGLALTVSHGVTEQLHNQSFSLGVNRCDYFYCVQSQFLKQVEVNTIASSFGALSPVIGTLHSYVLSILKKQKLLTNLPPNHALEELCSGMIFAWDLYSVAESVVLFIVEDVTYNICDQRFHEYEIRKKRPEIDVIRRTLTQISQSGKLTDDKRLIIDDMEVAVVYFRSGYEPGQYPSEMEWDARLNIERSRAIKCPSIYYHLAGAKKVQQEISMPGVLERYLEPEMAKEVSGLFTGLYTLDKGPEGDKAIAMALAEPQKYVLKPQREGGGNNVYGEEIRKFLGKMKDTREREAYILMDRIYPPVQRNYLIRSNEEAKLVDVVSELGIFGVIVGSKDKVVVNKFAGHMLRTKLSTVNEGGVAAGQGALDSVYLVS